MQSANEKEQLSNLTYERCELLKDIEIDDCTTTLFYPKALKTLPT